MKYDEGYHFITMVTNKRVEAFKHEDIARIAINTILFYEKRGDFRLKGFIVMPDHVHMICELPASEKPLEVSTSSGSRRSPDLPTIIRDIKKYIAKEAIARLSSLDNNMLLNVQLPKPKKRRHIYRFWQPDYYDFNILSERKLNEKLRYMYENPLRKSLCKNVFDYEFSDSKRYFGSGDPKLPPVWNDSIE
jgi:putative transposase